MEDIGYTLHLPLSDEPVHQNIYPTNDSLFPVFLSLVCDPYEQL